MTTNFWSTLPRPFFVQAPLENVTDAAFRKIISTYSKPDVMYTEFTSCDGLFSKGADAVRLNFLFSTQEQPIVAQIFGKNPETFRKAASLIAEMGFAGIDINMGCPDKAVCKSGAGAALINTPDLAREIIEATKEGANHLPLSVKTRLGFNKEQLDNWIPSILQSPIEALIIHARTKKELSLVPARWERISDIVRLRDELAPQVAIIGNGDVESIEDGRMKAKHHGVEGVMLGRALFGNPWLFRDQLYTPDTAEKLQVMYEHATHFVDLFAGKKNFAVMRKHFGSYCSGFPGAKELRVELLKTESLADVEKVLSGYLSLTKAAPLSDLQ
jgi:nifR3 family TIM-barrel protein